MNFRDAYEFDPESYAKGGGLPGLLRRVMQQQGAFGDTVANWPTRAWVIAYADRVQLRLI